MRTASLRIANRQVSLRTPRGSKSGETLGWALAIVPELYAGLRDVCETQALATATSRGRPSGRTRGRRRRAATSGLHEPTLEVEHHALLIVGELGIDRLVVSHGPKR